MDKSEQLVKNLSEFLNRDGERTRIVKWTLKQILDHETGDSSNGTHYRDISTVYDAGANKVAVISSNQMHSSEKCAVILTLDELKAQIDDARGARYFGDFCVSAKGILP